MKKFRSFILSPKVTIKLGTLVFSASAILFLLLVLRFDYGKEVLVKKAVYYSENTMSIFQSERSFYVRDSWCDNKLGGQFNAPQYVHIGDKSKIKSALIYARAYLKVDQQIRVSAQISSDKSQLFVNNELVLDSRKMVSDVMLTKGDNVLLLKSIIDSNVEVIEIQLSSEGREVELSDIGRVRGCTD